MLFASPGGRQTALCAVVILSVGMLRAADTTPVVRPPQVVGSSSGAAYEVETVVVSQDAAAIAAWAELAARGFHVVGTIPQGDKTVLLCERQVSLAQGDLRVPSVVAADATAATKLTATLRAILGERLHTSLPTVPAQPAPPAKP